MFNLFDRRSCKVFGKRHEFTESELETVAKQLIIFYDDHKHNKEPINNLFYEPPSREDMFRLLAKSGLEKIGTIKWDFKNK